MKDRFSKAYIESLAHKYRHGTLTPAEEADFEAWYDSHRDDTFAHSDAAHPDRAMRRMYRKIRRDANPPVTRKFRKWLPYAAAAGLFALAVGAWLLVGDQRPAVSLAAAEILPGGNRATLTLADGRTIQLDENKTGIVVENEDIIYIDGSTLGAVMPSDGSGMNKRGAEASQPNSGNARAMLTLTTPKGGTYHVTLPDGSKVWLNANSTLRYPFRFAGEAREVIFEGEAFFEVSRQPAAEHLPFRVLTRGQTIEVLGTEFNITAYTDDPETKTTLVEGKVKVMTGAHAAHVLSPGQQSTTRGTATEIREVDTEPYTAWKEGLFYFDNIPSRKAIEQVARWYDLDIVYDEYTPETFVFGMIDRDKPLSSVLNALAKSGLEFEVTLSGGRKQLHIAGKN